MSYLELALTFTGIGLLTWANYQSRTIFQLRHDLAVARQSEDRALARLKAAP